MFGSAPAASSGGFSFGAGASNSNASAPKASFSFGVPAANTNAPAAPAPSGSSSFSFGNTQNAGAAGQPAASGSLFGNTNTQQKPQQQSTGGGLFGSTPAASGGTFGQTTQTPGQTQGTGLFGQTNQAQAGQASTSGTSGTGMFGQQNTQNQPGQTGGLFGSTQQAKPSIFGSTSTTQPTSTFGQPAAQPANSLFGSTNQAQPQPSTSLFGSTQQPAQQGTSLFGSTTQPAQQPAGGSLFGSFGSSTAKPAGQTTGGLFGNTAQTAQAGASTSGGFGFGGLGQSQQQPQGSFGFGSTNQNQQQQMMQSQMQQPPSQLQMSILGQSTFKKDTPIQQRLEAIQAGWNAGHPDCRFKAFFYNLVEPHEVSRYTQPQNVSSDLWAKAERENPDRSCLVPVLATGWGDVEKRLKAQREMANAEQRQIQELSKTLATIERQKTLQATLKLVALQSRLAQLQHRLVHLAVNTGLAAQAGSSSSSSGTKVREQALRTALDDVKSEMDGTVSRAKPVHNAHLYSGNGSRPGTPRRNAAGQRMMGQVNELWGAVEELRRRKGYAVKEREGWLDDERIMGEIAKVLTEQQMALQKLNSVLEDSKFDAKVIGNNLDSLGLP